MRLSRAKVHCTEYGTVYASRMTSRMRDVGCVMLYSSTTRHYPRNCKVKVKAEHASNHTTSCTAKPKGHDVIVPGPFPAPIGAVAAGAAHGFG
jgi:hypothetical protein